MIEDLKKQDFHIVTITDLHIAHYPNCGYIPYDSGMAGDHFVKNPDGTPDVGKVWPGPSLFSGFTRPGTPTRWGALYAPFLCMGWAGLLKDKNEPFLFPLPTHTIPHHADPPH